MPNISSKGQNYQCYLNGEYGNKIKTWNNLEELRLDKPRELICVRYKSTNANFKKFNITFSDAIKWVEECVGRGAQRELFTFNESCIDDKLTIQGEYIVAPLTGHSLIYSTQKVPMSLALEREKISVEGIRALHTLQRHMNPNSFDDFQIILERFPGHAIEFSCYSCFVGMSPRRNTLFWEVRFY